MTCFECGGDYMIEQHHVVPRSVGGTKTVPLCVICHSKVHDRNFVKHRELQRKGIEKAKKEGRYRSNGGRRPLITDEQLIDKYDYVLDCIDNGMSYRKTAESCGVSIGTVQRAVKAKYRLNEAKHKKSLIKRIFKL